MCLADTTTNIPLDRGAMSHDVETKLATMIQYLVDVRNDRRHCDSIGFESYLDDPQLMDWLGRMNKQGRTVNTRFTSPG